MKLNRLNNYILIEFKEIKRGELKMLMNRAHIQWDGDKPFKMTTNPIQCCIYVALECIIEWFSNQLLFHHLHVFRQSVKLMERKK